MQRRLNTIFLYAAVLLLSCYPKEKKQSILFPEGGYNFLQTTNGDDSLFYWYPVKDILEPQDSILLAFEGADIYRLFNEPNLSIQPQKKPIFRLLCGSPGLLVTITESEMIIKEKKTGYPYPYIDRDKLSTDEQFDLNLFKTYYPLKKQNTEKSAWENKWLDSIVSVRSKLLTASYYLFLLQKAKTFTDEKFTYSTKRMSISPIVFKKITDTLAAANYWSQPYDIPCVGIPTDASSYILEANTPEKYNIVRVSDCDYDKSGIARAYDYIIQLAGLGDKVYIMGVR